MIPRIPIDSADARELREAEAEAEVAESSARPDAVANSIEAEGTHDLRCEDGWLGEDPDGRPIPCLACRRHLTTFRGAVMLASQARRERSIR